MSKDLAVIEKKKQPKIKFSFSNKNKIVATKTESLNGKEPPGISITSNNQNEATLIPAGAFVIKNKKEETMILNSDILNSSNSHVQAQLFIKDNEKCHISM